MRKIVAAFLLSLIMVSTTTGHISEPIKPLPFELYEPVVIPSPTPTPTPTPTPEPTPTPTPKPKARQMDKAYAIVIGTASTYGDGYAGFLALPEGPGVKVKVTGPGGWIIRVSNDAGPSLAMQRQGRVIDLNASDFNTVCGCDWKVKGLVKVKVEYLR